jgi:hypothetical protein
VTARHRLIPASEPGAVEACRMTSDDGARRRADLSALFARLVEQKETARGNEFVFRGDSDELWEMVTAFVDDESRCCPFYSYEQRETLDGVTLFVGAPPARIELKAP